jgi:hypothetical protein
MRKRGFVASIRMSIPIGSPAPAVWAAIADTGAVHERLARDFVVDTRLEGDSRVVTFENGLVTRELLVDVDEDARRIAYAVVESPLGIRHHHASMEVLADGDEGSWLLWVADVAPDDAGTAVGEFMRLGADAIRRTLEA